jgi:hypothetical protein
LRKWTWLVITVVSIVSMISFPASTSPNAVRAQEPSTHRAFLPAIRTPSWLYIPLVRYMEPILFDDFQDQDPQWQQFLLKDPTDGWFEHLNGKYAAHIDDNSAVMVASPGWRPLGDFKLEVDGRHLGPDKKSFNALGLAFSGDDDWSGFYGMMIAAGSVQHFWAVVRFTQQPNERDVLAKALTNNGYRGGPNSMKGHAGSNRLMVVRIGDTIKPYCNGRSLPVGDGRRYVVDSTYGPNRQVGVVVTSYEFSDGEIDFDNFELTPLYGADPDEYTPPEAVIETNDEIEIDMPVLDIFPH